MKRKILPVFLWIVFLSEFSFAQIKSGEVTYKADMVKKSKILSDSLRRNSPQTYSFFQRGQEQIRRALPGLSFKLKFNQEASLYQGETMMDIGDQQSQMRAVLQVRGEGVYYNEINKDLRLHQFKIPFGDDIFLIEKKISDLDWKIHKETRKIAGYDCIRATAVVNLNSIRKGKITAWFAKELPFHFGPIGYVGLPGLILDLEMQNFHIYADQIKLSKSSLTIKEPREGERMTYKEYVKKSEDYMRNLLLNRGSDK